MSMRGQHILPAKMEILLEESSTRRLFSNGCIAETPLVMALDFVEVEVEAIIYIIQQLT